MENSPEVRIDFRSKQAFRRKNGLLSPPNSQNSQVEPARTLISPPPEEELDFIRSHSRSNSFSKPNPTKRKRPSVPLKMPSTATIRSVEVTPNPKPRKRTHTRSNSQQSIPSPTRKLVESPHISNPNADFIPPYLVSVTNSMSRRRRSATPASIPPYEPPTDLDKFTPPREIFLTPSKPKPKQKRKSRGLKLDTIIVKKERPEDVDQTLHKPMPPPSPTDDPLLLKFNERRRPRMSKSKVDIKDIYEDTFVPLNDSRFESVLPSLPPASPMKDVVSLTRVGESMTKSTLPALSSPQDEVTAVDYFAYPAQTPEPKCTLDLEKESMDLAAATPLFPESMNDGGWSDSDFDEEFPVNEAAGHETYADSLIPIRSSPPYGVSRNIHDSPHPRRSSVGLFIEDQGTTVVGPDGTSDDEEEREVREMSVPLEEEVMDVDDGNSSLHIVGSSGDESPHPRRFSVGSFIEDQGTTVVGSDTHSDGTSDDEEEREVREMSVPLEEEVMDIDDGNSSLHTVESSGDDTVDEEQQVREMSLRLESEEQSRETEVSSNPIQRLALAPDLSTLKDDGTGSESKEFITTPTSPSLSPSTSVEIVNAEGSDDELEQDGELVKISSADPLAAAKAAAILKQHDYDCFTKIRTVEELSKASRRKTISGVVKPKLLTSFGSSSPNHSTWRQTSGGVISGTNKVYLPGSPVVLTLDALLEKAEKEVQMASGGNKKANNIFATPTPVPARAPENLDSSFDPTISGLFPITPFSTSTPAPRRGLPEAEWTRDNWRRLDSCYTDERIAVFRRGSAAFSFRSPGPNDLDNFDFNTSGEEEMAAVDAVRLEDVVNRFVKFEGGWHAVQEKGWSRSYLLQRTSALQIKQRSGRAAPPSRSSSPMVFTPESTSLRRIEVPDFTPLPRRNTLSTQVTTPLNRPILPLPLVDDYPFKESQDKGHVPSPLLAPRYAELLEEAESISASVVSIQPQKVQANKSPTPADSSISRRFKGFLTSYLPTLSSSAKVHAKQPAASSRMGLPLPPEEVLKKSRGAINTPIRPPQPRGKVHKDMVNLHHPPPPQPPKLSKPRPKRLVELNPVAPPVQTVEPPRPRRSSGGSVKDLVKNFEDLDKSVRLSSGDGASNLKRVKSWVGGQNVAEKPRWRI